MPCYPGAPPKPKKALIGQTIEYYLDVANRSLAEARSEEYKALVVEKASDCKGVAAGGAAAQLGQGGGVPENSEGAA